MQRYVVAQHVISRPQRRNCAGNNTHFACVDNRSVDVRDWDIFQGSTCVRSLFHSMSLQVRPLASTSCVRVCPAPLVSIAKQYAYAAYRYAYAAYRIFHNAIGVPRQRALQESSQRLAQTSVCPEAEGFETLIRALASKEYKV